MTSNRLFKGDDLVIASHNQGKVREIGDLLAPFRVTVKSAGELSLPEPEETGASFVENAELKARAAVKGSGLCALADDSGLCVTSLDNAPGIYSARWAGPEGDFDAAMQRLQTELGDSGDRRAWFACALSLCWPDGHCETFEGRVDGTLVWPPCGDQGFGYDPMFVPTGSTQTFGEFAPDDKHAISHRAHAFRQLTAACFRAGNGG